MYTFCVIVQQYQHDYTMAATKIATTMVELDEIFEVGERCFPHNPTVSRIHSTTESLYKTYGADANVVENNMFFESQEMEDEMIAFAVAAEIAYKKKMAIQKLRSRMQAASASVRLSQETSSPIFTDGDANIGGKTSGVVQEFVVEKAPVDLTGSVVCTEEVHIGVKAGCVVQDNTVEKEHSVMSKHVVDEDEVKVAGKETVVNEDEVKVEANVRGKNARYPSRLFLRNNTSPTSPITRLHECIVEYIYSEIGSLE